MEFEDIDTQIEWEARRVAAAFGVEEWSRTHPLYGWDLESMSFAGQNGPHTIRWQFGGEDETKAQLDCVDVGDTDAPGTSLVFNDILEMHYGPLPDELELMAHGLYCLGFEDESLLSQPPELSAHEKLELRLSLHHPFWPRT